MDTIKASTIYDGTYERKALGLVWCAPGIMGGGAGTAHTSSLCSRLDVAVADRVPAYEEDGVTYVAGERTVRVNLCTQCPPNLDQGWREEAQCRDTLDNRAFSTSLTWRDKSDLSPHDEFIAEYCDRCPVIQDCLEYGAGNHASNVGAVWGGVYFLKNKEKRVKAIEKKRKELA